MYEKTMNFSLSLKKVEYKFTKNFIWVEPYTNNLRICFGPNVDLLGSDLFA